jgi:hypothetical protein
VFAQITDIETCASRVSELAETYVAGHGGYMQDSQTGYCVRRSDNEYDSSNLTTLFASSDSIQQCIDACNEDEECVSIDYGPEGYCYSYKMDLQADYVGNGDADWSCYHKIVIPTGCNSSYVTEAVAMQT